MMGKRRESVVVEKRRRGLEGRVRFDSDFFFFPPLHTLCMARTCQGGISQQEHKT